jgi:hypothetical protein
MNVGKFKKNLGITNTYIVIKTTKYIARKFKEEF